MNNHETIKKLNEMRLHGMVRALKSSMETGHQTSYTSDELLAFIVESEWDDRQNRRLRNLVKKANFRYEACFEELSYTTQRNLDKNTCLRLATCEFLKQAENVLITGPTGIGKSFLSSAIGNRACQLGYKVKYANMGKLFEQFRLFQADGSYMKQIAKIAKTDLLILDDFGIKPFDGQERLMLMEIMEDRHGRCSTVITSQHPISSWYDVIGEATLADAILDRLVHCSHKIKMEGSSMREVMKKNVASETKKK